MNLLILELVYIVRSTFIVTVSIQHIAYVIVLLCNVTCFVSKNCNTSVLRIVLICQMHIIFIVHILIYTFPFVK